MMITARSQSIKTALSLWPTHHSIRSNAARPTTTSMAREPSDWRAAIRNCRWTSRTHHKGSGRLTPAGSLSHSVTDSSASKTPTKSSVSSSTSTQRLRTSPHRKFRGSSGRTASSRRPGLQPSSGPKRCTHDPASRTTPTTTTTPPVHGDFFAMTGNSSSI